MGSSSSTTGRLRSLVKSGRAPPSQSIFLHYVLLCSKTRIILDADDSYLRDDAWPGALLRHYRLYTAPFALSGIVGAHEETQRAFTSLPVQLHSLRECHKACIA